MSARRLLSLFAALALMSPLAASGLPECAPGPHCPMAAAMGADAPCGGAVMQEDDCCVAAPAAAAAEVLPVIAAAAAALDDGAPAPLPAAATGKAGIRGDAPSPPLYRLFRALLI